MLIAATGCNKAEKTDKEVVATPKVTQQAEITEMPLSQAVTATVTPEPSVTFEVSKMEGNDDVPASFESICECICSDEKSNIAIQQIVKSTLL